MSFDVIPAASHTIIRAAQFNDLQQRIADYLATVPSSATLLSGQIITAEAAGTGDLIGLTPLNGDLAAYEEGQFFGFTVIADNTGPAAVNISLLGAIALKAWDSSQLQAGDMKAGQFALIGHNGVEFRLVSVLGGMEARVAASATAAAASAAAALVSQNASAASAVSSGTSAMASAASAAHFTFSGAGGKNVTVANGGIIIAAGATFTNPISTAGIVNVSAGGISDTSAAAITQYQFDQAGNFTAVGIGVASTAGGGAGFSVVCGASGGVFLGNGATSWVAFSDERGKTPFAPFASALAKVASIKVGTGRYLSDDDNVSRSFLSAQSLQAVLPEAVSVYASPRDAQDNIKNPEMDGLLVASYTDAVPLLIAAFAETKALLDEAKALIDAQNIRIATLEARP